MRFYEIIMGDSRSMEEVPNDTVDLVVTSPPYWHLDVFSKPGDKGAEDDLSRYLKKEDFFRELGKVWKECERVLKPGGMLVCEWEDYPPGSRMYGYPREICLCGPMVQSIEDAHLHLISRWTWRKFESGVALNKFQYTMFDNLNHAVPRAVANWAYVYAFMRRSYSPRRKRLDFSRKEWKLWSDGVWNIEAKTSGASEFISGGAVFPLELVKRIIRIYTVKDETVLDPFLGTGTTMKAAFDLERSCIGYEVLKKMLRTIKSKVGFGQQPLGESVRWEVRKR